MRFLANMIVIMIQAVWHNVRSCANHALFGYPMNRTWLKRVNNGRFGISDLLRSGDVTG